MLVAEGHQVHGYALPADEESIFRKLEMSNICSSHVEGDIRDLSSMATAAAQANPDVIIHLAAQPLVIRGYEEPFETFSTNVNGTLNLLQVASDLRTNPTVLVVTTDKVYRPKDTGSHAETDALGGLDPYSASKAMADLMSQSWSNVHSGLGVAVARAGNVIGPFDHSENRLLPDINRALARGESLSIRFPSAVRPWQHVLDCLAGYLRFIGFLRTDPNCPKVMNFGPDPREIRKVQDVVNLVSMKYPEFKFKVGDAIHDENPMLLLDNGLAKNFLDWRAVFSFQEAVEMSVQPSRTPREIREIILRQIKLHSSSLGHPYVQ
jgi:CDP-glucose 4,6-dehydratase